MKRIISLTALLLFGLTSLHAQPDSTWADQTNQSAIYNRPFIQLGKLNTAVGGYVEANTNYFSEDGVSDGFSMEFRRFNLFLYSNIHRRIRFLSELEFEHGTEEIKLETAVVDFEIFPSLTLRTGILLPPIGAFNQNHDSPKWDIVDRPLVSTTLIPSTLSEVGFGAYGRFPGEKWVFTYEAYLVNGLQDGVVGNALGRTSIPDGKNGEMFGGDNNGRPMMTGRVALANRKWGELGLSAYGGTYNRFQSDGLAVDTARGLFIAALDYALSLGKLNFKGEAAYAQIETPQNMRPLSGTRQAGFFADLIYPVLQKPVLKWEDARLNLVLRGEWVDYNIGSFESTGGDIADDVWAIVPGISFRPGSNTVIRANYRREWWQDALGNPPANRAGFQVGVASYF